ncbi:HAD family phosphatase [Streptomyces sp. SLBN-31]|uniref:HAD family hydrolase n=1 Tax=Streptomyces sp. SLBN-31 TaxID=2768444 RepID=UPI00116DF0A2|nr:HAD family hydrolase [Streptomyces sp. SLBN-31]TQJ92921.1 HAD superfamily hydrolase (TIGR01490 family) [Streptomyces sp. SLBN-31]
MSRPPLLVFSDVDETLIAGKSMFDFLAYYLRATRGTPGARHAADVRQELSRRTSAGAPREAMNRLYYRTWAGEPAARVEELARAWYAERSGAPGFYLAATRRALELHRAAGDTVILVSGSFPAVLAPIAAEVGATRLLCSVPEVHDGVLTGRLVGDPCIGEAKRAAVRAMLQSRPALDPAQCFAYGDHVSDLPMLAEVGNPVIVGGSARLRARLPRARVLHPQAVEDVLALLRPTREQSGEEFHRAGV